MPRYQITDSTSGHTMVVEGDSPPTDQEAADLFAGTGGDSGGGDAAAADAADQTPAAPTEPSPADQEVARKAEIERKRKERAPAAKALANRLADLPIPGLGFAPLNYALLTQGGRVGDIAAEVLPPIGGAIAGSFVAPGLGTAAGGAAGGAEGDSIAQLREYFRGERDSVSKGRLAAATIASAIPVEGSLLTTAPKAIGIRALQGAGIAGAADVTGQLIDTGTVDFHQLTKSVAFGTIFGAAGGGAEAVATRRAVLKAIRQTPEFAGFKGTDSELVDAVRNRMRQDAAAPADPTNVTPASPPLLGSPGDRPVPPGQPIDATPPAPPGGDAEAEFLAAAGMGPSPAVQAAPTPPAAAVAAVETPTSPPVVAPAAPADIPGGNGELLPPGEIPFNLSSESQAAPEAPAAAEAQPELIPAAQVRSTAPTALDEANAAARAQITAPAPAPEGASGSAEAQAPDINPTPATGGQADETVPAVPEAVNPPSAPVPVRPAVGGRNFSIHHFPPAADGTLDLLNAIAHLGGVPGPGKNSGGEYDGYAEAFGTGPARLLRRKGAGSGRNGIDTFIPQLEDQGYKFDSVESFYKAVTAASQRRQAIGRQIARQSYIAKTTAALFDNAGRPLKYKAKAPVSRLTRPPPMPQHYQDNPEQVGLPPARLRPSKPDRYPELEEQIGPWTSESIPQPTLPTRSGTRVRSGKRSPSSAPSPRSQPTTSADSSPPGSRSGR